MSGRPLSGTSAALILMRLSWVRLFRNKAFWLSIALAALPLLFLASLASNWDPDERWSRTLAVAVIPLLGILTPLNLAPIVAEEAEDETFSYLWSRPLPRWSVIAGKSAALVPFCWGLLFASVAAVWAISFGGQGDESWRLVRGLLAIGLGVVATGAISVGLGVLIRRQAVAVSAGYLLVVDLPLGNVPLSIANLSVTHHVSEIAARGAESAAAAPGMAAPLAWLLGLTAAWLALAVWRIERIELGSSD